MYFIASFSFLLLLLLCIESTYSHFSCVCINVKKTSSIHLHFLSADRHQWAAQKVLGGSQESDFTRLSMFIDETFKLLNCNKATLTKNLIFIETSGTCRTVHVLTASGVLSPHSSGIFEKNRDGKSMRQQS